jgi:hypothetical protein
MGDDGGDNRSDCDIDGTVAWDCGFFHTSSLPL